MKGLAARMKEPSSWAGISVILTLLAPHIGLTAEAVPHLVSALAGLAGVLSIALPEKGE